MTCLSTQLRQECCGTCCDKMALADRVAELEQALDEAMAAIKEQVSHMHLINEPYKAARLKAVYEQGKALTQGGGSL